MRIQAERRSPVVSKSLPIQFIAIFKVLIIRELFTSARNVKHLIINRSLSAIHRGRSEFNFYCSHKLSDLKFYRMQNYQIQSLACLRKTLYFRE